MSETQAERLLRLAAATGYWYCTSTRGEPYGIVTGESIARPLRGGRGSVRADLARLYARTFGGAPNANSLADVMLTLEGQAYAGDEVELHLRTARRGDTVWLDLGTASGELARITAAGWEIVPGDGPLFRRTRLTGPLPDPVPGGDLGALRAMMRISDSMWPLVTAWLVSALLLPAQPVPVLALSGEQGTAKSYQTRLLVQLIDPSPSPLRTAPRDVESWAVAAAASRVVALDNVSRIEPWLSDCLCRAVTGDGLVRRALYTSEDVSVLAFRRAIIVNGIALGGLRGDLADRLIRVDLQPLGEESRRDEADLAAQWEKTHPQALGGLLDLASAVLSALPSVRLERMPRMADYARVLAAVGQVTGAEGLAAYLGQREGLAAEAVADSPVARAVQQLAVARRGEGLAPWEGTAAELLAVLPAPRTGPDASAWPGTARGMTARLTRDAPALRATGTAVDVISVPRASIRQRNAPQRWRIGARPPREQDTGRRPQHPDVPRIDLSAGQATDEAGDVAGTSETSTGRRPRDVPGVLAGQQPYGTWGTSGTSSRHEITHPPLCPDCDSGEDTIIHAVCCLGEDPAA